MLTPALVHAGFTPSGLVRTCEPGVSRRLGISFQLVLAEFSRRLDAAGHGDVRPVHGMTFQILYGDGATSSELAERLGVVTRLLARQLLKGW